MILKRYEYNKVLGLQKRNPDEESNCFRVRQILSPMIPPCFLLMNQLIRYILFHIIDFIIQLKQNTIFKIDVKKISS